ncbi:protein of unknown function [Paraburkholderia kururiensis]
MPHRLQTMRAKRRVVPAEPEAAAAGAAAEICGAAERGDRREYKRSGERRWLSRIAALKRS